MENIDFIKEIMTNKDVNNSYWVVARKMTSRQYFETKREKDSIIFVTFDDVPRCKYEELLLKDIEKVYNMNFDRNIYLTNGYTPFQYGLNFFDMYKGFHIKSNASEFLKKALELDSNNLHDYKKLYEDINKLNKEN